MRRELINAIYDYRLLLDRGYPQKVALDAVCTRYMLSRRERLLLYRCIHPTNIAKKIRRKHSIPPPQSTLVVDGFNVFATLYTVYTGEHVYLCDDGIVRDLSGLHSRVALTMDKNVAGNLLSLIINYANKFGYRLELIFDYNVKKSGELASYIRKQLSTMSIYWNVSVEKQADSRILSRCTEGVWVSTSDIVILEKAERIFDLAGYIIRDKYPRYVIKIPLEN